MGFDDSTIKMLPLAGDGLLNVNGGREHCYSVLKLSLCCGEEDGVILAGHFIFGVILFDFLEWLISHF